MSGHTPGPWSVFAAGWDEEGHVQYTLMGVTVVRADDARLIGAAPDGLALAEEFLAFARSGASFAYPLGSLQRLEQFVAKARGQ